MDENKTGNYVTEQEANKEFILMLVGNLDVDLDLDLSLDLDSPGAPFDSSPPPPLLLGSTGENYPGSVSNHKGVIFISTTTAKSSSSSPQWSFGL